MNVENIKSMINIEPFYQIGIFNKKDNEMNYLSFDEHSGGYPYWSSFKGQEFNEKETEVYINEIKKCFVKLSGEYFNSNLEPKTLVVIKFDIVEITKIDFETPSKQDIMKKQILSKLSPEELAYIKENKI